MTAQPNFDEQEALKFDEPTRTRLAPVGFDDDPELALAFARPPHPVRKAQAEWWRDPARKYLSMSLPIYALRDVRRPGIGKFTDLGRIYRDQLSRQGIDTVVLLPPFQSTHESPYSPISVYALNELYIDWSIVPEVASSSLVELASTKEDPRYVHYEDERRRAALLRNEAYMRFRQYASHFRQARFDEFVQNQRAARNWLEDYASFVATREQAGLGGISAEANLASHRFAQWIAYNQFRQAIRTVQATGGHVVIDLPLFRSANGVDVEKYPEYFRPGHPGAGGQVWGDQALWNWERLRQEDSKFILDPIEHWLDFGCDGARIDAAANAFAREGQSGSGDEDGERFVSDLARVFHERDALALVEVLCAPEVTDAVERHGLLALFRDWQVYSTHDFLNPDLSQDPERFLDEVKHLLRDTDSRRGHRGALFVNITFLDVEGDPFRLKRVEERNGRTESIWETQMSLPSDEDYHHRARWDRGFSLACIVAEETGRRI
ncbi:MAG: 4-alpha-glucanotransferase [Polyangiaceae bacterium]